MLSVHNFHIISPAYQFPLHNFRLISIGLLGLGLVLGLGLGLVLGLRLGLGFELLRDTLSEIY